ncbi:MAG TPA: FAD-dependent oxidoreductase [Phycisphaerae bacterium]|nr:FAD-dependent oxidoreductase [Phycisphaerae bacterium]HOB73733.1 FAD-dependent oxidoreductase [Phycisphaerae bacterium]HOJ53393.1 FAD-dependent oxidoreductase [Phycisphaerae bacterium]HOL25483.1 FAD-dependent oxidoreductase [Phycisphaerae bacterium]HPP19840.1 FAD-dependent oxidoreductase [Phycisphaerae bacterium]
MSHQPQPDFSRRDLLKKAGHGVLLSGTLAAGHAARADVSEQSQASQAPSAAPATPPSGSDAASPSTALGKLFKGHTLEADVVIAGGGMAGVCAALAAARNGASVVLIQDRAVLGGNASSEVRMHIVGADASGARKNSEARESGLIEEIRLAEAMANPQRSASMLDLVLLDRVRGESNITLLLNTHCIGVHMAAENRIAAVTALQRKDEKVFTVRGKVFIDCTGDGGLGAEAGAIFRMGREGRDEYGESMAPPQPDNKTLGSSLLFQTRRYDRPMRFQPPSWIRRFDKCEDLPFRGHNAWEFGFWWVEWGGELNTISDDERIRDELLAAALGVWDHIKNSGRHPKSANWALEWLGFLPGKRESRRFIGDHVLTQQEVQRGETFADGVAFGGWPIDLHPPKGIYSPERPADQTQVPLYNIPLRCLYSKNIENLLFAGRNISTSHVAFGSTRVMATCAVVGQAAGTAAAMCARGGVTPRTLARDGIAELQQRLLKDDAYIIGATNSDPADLARSAEVRASSETADGVAANVINGIHRGTPGKSNRWISDSSQAMPQWLELRFREPQRIREVHLVFDTGLHRVLTLTQSDAYNARMVRGPQPETVRDYDLLLLSGQNATTVAEVRGNYQRKSIYRFKPKTADGIRLLVHATNGAPEARVFEVRAYA